MILIMECKMFRNEFKGKGSRTCRIIPSPHADLLSDLMMSGNVTDASHDGAGEKDNKTAET